MALNITITGNGFTRLSEAVRALGERRAHTAYSRAITNTGKVAGTAAGRALAKQTGLPAKIAGKAMKRSVTHSTPETLTYIIRLQGGDIALKYFNPEERKKGVSARPFGRRKIFKSTFTHAGFWPVRVKKPGWNAHVFKRTGGTTKYGKDEFERQNSGVIIPNEAMEGRTAAAWRATTSTLQDRIATEIRKVTKRAIT